MNTISKRLMTLVALLMVAVVITTTGCKPSVAGQTEDWKANQEHLTALNKDYPAFAGAVAAVKAKADAAWAEAEKVTDEDKKAEAMLAANDIIAKGFAGHLHEFNGLIEEIGKFQEKLAGKKMSSSLVAKYNDAVDPADEAIDAAYGVMETGAADIAAADALVNPVYDKLKASRDKWSSIEDAYDAEQKKNKKKGK